MKFKKVFSTFLATSVLSTAFSSNIFAMFTTKWGVPAEKVKCARLHSHNKLDDDALWDCCEVLYSVYRGNLGVGKYAGKVREIVTEWLEKDRRCGVARTKCSHEDSMINRMRLTAEATNNCSAAWGEPYTATAFHGYDTVTPNGWSMYNLMHEAFARKLPILMETYRKNRGTNSYEYSRTPRDGFQRTYILAFAYDNGSVRAKCYEPTRPSNSFFEFHTGCFSEVTRSCIVTASNEEEHKFLYNTYK